MAVVVVVEGGDGVPTAQTRGRKWRRRRREGARERGWAMA